MGKASIKMKRSPLSLSSGAVSLLTLLGCHPLLPPTQFVGLERQHTRMFTYIYIYIFLLYLFLISYADEDSPVRLHRAELARRNVSSRPGLSKHLHDDQDSAKLLPQNLMHFDMFAGCRNLQRAYCCGLICKCDHVMMMMMIQIAYNSGEAGLRRLPGCMQAGSTISSRLVDTQIKHTKLSDYMDITGRGDQDDITSTMLGFQSHASMESAHAQTCLILISS